MLESGLSGSERGVPSNGHPYRDPRPLAEAKKAREKRVSIWARVKAVPVPDHRINSFCACYNNTFPETQGKSTFHRSNPLGGPSLDAERSLN